MEETEAVHTNPKLLMTNKVALLVVDAILVKRLTDGSK
jgi:hypothetical protein